MIYTPYVVREKGLSGIFVSRPVVFNTLHVCLDVGRVGVQFRFEDRIVVSGCKCLKQNSVCQFYLLNTLKPNTLFISCYLMWISLTVSTTHCTEILF